MEQSIANILENPYDDSDSGSIDPETGSHRATPLVPGGSPGEKTDKGRRSSSNSSSSEEAEPIVTSPK